MQSNSNSLSLALSAGLRKPLGIKSALGSWLGQTVTLKDGEFWRAFFGGTAFTSRPSVEQTMSLSTAWACVRLIAETIATLPLGLYTRLKDGSRELATSHQLYEILHNTPNAEMTAVSFWEVVIASMLLWGNAYIEIQRLGGRVVALNFLVPSRVMVRRKEGGGIEYKYREAGRITDREINPADMMHIPAFSLDGLMGISPVQYGCNVFGTAMDTDRASAETFQHSMRSPGLITMNEVMDKPQRDKLRAHIKQVSEDHGVMILEGSTKFEPLSWDPVSSELLKSREWNAEEICRWFGVDPALVGRGGKDSNWGTGLEQKMLWLITLTLRKWCVRIEQGIRRSLLTPAERAKYFAEFALEGLLRGDSAARANFYASVTQNGIYTRDDCRVKENLPRMGGNAAVLTVQSNMMPIDKLGEKPEDVAAKDALQKWLGLGERETALPAPAA